MAALLAIAMAASTIFEAGSFATRAKLAAVGSTVFGHAGAGGHFTVAIEMGTVFFSHGRFLLLP